MCWTLCRRRDGLVSRSKLRRTRAGVLGASWPLRTTASVSLSTSRVLFTPNLDVG